MQEVFTSATFHTMSLKHGWLQGAVDKEGTAGCVQLVQFTRLRVTDKGAGSEQARSLAAIRERTERF